MNTPSRLFYVLPQLFAGGAPFPVKAKHVSLEISCADLAVEPRDGKVYLSRPLPNKGYVIGHDKKNRLGWFVPFSQCFPDLEIIFRWHIHIPEHDYRFCVEHRLHVEILDGCEDLDGGQIWSMDVMPWYGRGGFYRGEPPVNMQPSSRLAMEEIHPVREVGLIGVTKGGIAYEEYLAIPPVSQKEFVSRWIGHGCGIAPVIPLAVADASSGAGGGE